MTPDSPSVSCPRGVWARPSSGPCIDAPGRPRSFKPPGIFMLSGMVIKNGSLCPLRHLTDASTGEPSGPKAENRGTVHGERGGRETIFLLERMGVSKDTLGSGYNGLPDHGAGGGVRRRGEKVAAKAARRVTSPAGQPDFERAISRRGRASRGIRSVAWRLARALRNAKHHSRAVMPGCVQDGCMGRGHKVLPYVRAAHRSAGGDFIPARVTFLRAGGVESWTQLAMAPASPQGI